MTAARALSLASLLLVGCGSYGAVYPPRPPGTPGAPVADPAPARVVTHVTITGAGLKSALDESVPRKGEGTFPLLHTTRKYTWERVPLDVSFAQGRIVLDAHVRSTVDMPVGSLEFPIDVRVLAEPVLSTEYKVKLQSLEVKVSSTDRRLKVADYAANVFDAIGSELTKQLKDFAYDVKPSLEEAYARVAKPIDLPIGDAHGCATLKVLGIEAGPTVVADGLEKDVALVVQPEVTIPCAVPETPPLPPFANVATLQGGPFTVVIPIAARYDELTKAMGTLFTDGKYFFSAEYPKLYLENPEVYESQGQVVVKVHVKGPVHKLGTDLNLDGDLFLSGHLSVADNDLSVPDLESTIETKNFFLSLKALADGDKIRDQARGALRLDLSERLKSVKDKVSSEMTFGDAKACFKGALDKIEVTSVHAHGSYLRVYVAVTAHANATMPCRDFQGSAASTSTPDAVTR
ncbi:MAG: hypothetical protein JWP97_3094 [Labilithrix sp.]|nr:hypothetical protein [Labilithrix sp.]